MAVTTGSQAASKLTVATLTREQRKKLQKISSKYEKWYTLGVINLMVTTVIAVRFPSYYWMYYTLKVLYYLPYRLYRFQKRNWELYLLDWCYVVNYISDLCVILAALRVAFGVTTPLVKYNAALIKAGFSMACGPLASSVYIFRNSVVFHDVDHNTSVFIHLAPIILMWCLRFGAGYGPGYVHHDFPVMFHLCESNQDYTAADECLQTWRGSLWCNACSASISSFLVLPAVLYIFVWMVPYFLVVFVWWRDWIQETKRETLYTHLIDSNPWLEAFFLKYFGIVVGEKYAGPVGYLVCHFMWTMTLAAVSYLLWHSFVLYNVAFIFILVTAIQNGSTYMFRVFAYRYASDQLKKHASLLE